MSQTQAVLDHHLRCFGACDLEGILSDYTSSSVVLTPEGAVRGLEDIRGFFADALVPFRKPGTSFVMKKVLVEDDCAFIAWEAETADLRFEAATDTFIIRDGRIAVQTYSAKVTPKTSERTAAADVRDSQEAASAV